MTLPPQCLGMGGGRHATGRHDGRTGPNALLENLETVLRHETVYGARQALAKRVDEFGEVAVQADDRPSMVVEPDAVTQSEPCGRWSLHQSLPTSP
ncbi:hypothetical protein [Streptomyces sp. NPDC060002]|uniref:hypothetical protein n=1 Tax=Streptomyces sp. NPDC060002 TaxID=3347033 RepID=UPI00369B8C05